MTTHISLYSIFFSVCFVYKFYREGIEFGKCILRLHLSLKKSVNWADLFVKGCYRKFISLAACVCLCKYVMCGKMSDSHFNNSLQFCLKVLTHEFEVEIVLLKVS